MSEVQDPDAEHDDDSTIPDAAATTAAVRAAISEVMSEAGNPIAKVVSDNIHHIATVAWKGHPGVADVIGVGDAVQDSIRHLYTPRNGGISSSARTAMEAVSRGVEAWTNGPLSGLSREVMGGHRNVTDLINAAAPGYTSPFDQLRQHRLDAGVGRQCAGGDRQVVHLRVSRRRPTAAVRLRDQPAVRYAVRHGRFDPS